MKGKKVKGCNWNGVIKTLLVLHTHKLLIKITNYWLKWPGACCFEDFTYLNKVVIIFADSVEKSHTWFTYYETQSDFEMPKFKQYLN